MTPFSSTKCGSAPYHFCVKERCAQLTHIVQKHKSDRRVIQKSGTGFVALISVLLVGSVAFLIALGVSLRSLNADEQSYAEERYRETLFLAELCAERALRSAMDDPGYFSETVETDGGSCQVVSVERDGPENLTIKTEAVEDEYTKRFLLTAIFSEGGIDVVSWQEVRDF